MASAGNKAWARLDHRQNLQRGEDTMLSWSLTFLILGLIAGVFGLSGIAGAATQIAWILFVIFLVLYVISIFSGRRTPPV